jgi:hypothetical protein
MHCGRRIDNLSRGGEDPGCFELHLMPGAIDEPVVSGGARADQQKNHNGPEFDNSTSRRFEPAGGPGSLPSEESSQNSDAHFTLFGLGQWNEQNCPQTRTSPALEMAMNEWRTT